MYVVTFRYAAMMAEISPRQRLGGQRTHEIHALVISSKHYAVTTQDFDTADISFSAVIVYIGAMSSDHLNYTHT